jgi:RNA polymerase sigma-70 factor (ECF subfamily)
MAAPRSATLGSMRRSSAPADHAVVRALPFAGDDAALLAGLRAGQTASAIALVDRYGPHLERVLCRVLGPDQELTDVLHDVIVQALAHVDDVRDADALKAWLTQIAVFCARGVIRRRRRRSWLSFRRPSDLPDVPAPETSTEARDVLAATYAILDQLPEDERIAFSLRFVDQMELASVASALGVSLATAKRVLRRAESRFLAFAQRYPAVLDAIEQGGRWKEQP